MIYQPTYTLEYDCPMGMRITDLPAYRVYAAGGGGAERLEDRVQHKTWSKEDELFLFEHVINGSMTPSEAAAHLGCHYDRVSAKLYRVRRKYRKAEEHYERNGEIMQRHGAGESTESIAAAYGLSPRRIAVIIAGGKSGNDSA